MKKIANRFIKLDYDWLIDEKVMELAEQEGISGLGSLVVSWSIIGREVNNDYKTSRTKLVKLLILYAKCSKDYAERIVDYLIQIEILKLDEASNIYSGRLRDELIAMDKKKNRLRNLNRSGLKKSTQEGTQMATQETTHMGTQEGTQMATQETTHMGTQEGTQMATHSRARVEESKNRVEESREDIKEIIPKGIKENQRFSPPTLEMVKEFVSENNISIDAEKFINFYECKGWMVGKNKMKNWKAAVRNWERSDKDPIFSNRTPSIVIKDKGGFSRDNTGIYSTIEAEEFEV